MVFFNYITQYTSISGSCIYLNEFYWLKVNILTWSTPSLRIPGCLSNLCSICVPLARCCAVPETEGNAFTVCPPTFNSKNRFFFTIWGIFFRCEVELVDSWFSALSKIYERNKFCTTRWVRHVAYVCVLNCGAHTHIPSTGGIRHCANTFQAIWM